MAKITSFAASIAFICTIVSISVFVIIRSSEDAILDLGDKRSETIRTKVGLSSYAPKDASFPEHLNTKDDKFCVIHVGPHKTGTTTLQIFLSEEPEAKDALKRDNYKGPSFPGIVRRNLSDFVYCFGPNLSRLCPTETFRSNMKKNFASFVSDAAIGGSNIIFSSEEFDRSFLNITEFMSYLVPEYKIHIVVYYRRFYDWIYSLYNQVEKSSGVEPLTFVDWLSAGRNFEMYGNGKQILSPLGVYDKYKKAPEVFKVTVVNTHEDPDNFNTLTRFTCDHMDDAPELCKVAKSQEIGRSNSSEDLNWRIFKSRVRQYHSIKLSKEDVRWPQILRRFNEMTDIPQVCLSSEWKEKLLQLSLEAEIAITPEWWHNSDEGLENLKSDFEEKIKSSLCSIDIETILKSLEWQNFLTELEEDEIEDGS